MESSHFGPEGNISSFHIVSSLRIFRTIPVVTMTRWWFQTFFMFTPKIGEDSHFDSYFSRRVGSTTNQMIYGENVASLNPWTKRAEPWSLGPEDRGLLSINAKDGSTVPWRSDDGFFWERWSIVDVMAPFCRGQNMKSCTNDFNLGSIWDIFIYIVYIQSLRLRNVAINFHGFHDMLLKFQQAWKNCRI